MSRVILDEGVPRQVGDHLPGHSITTVPIEGWASVKNGELLALIGEAGFSAFINPDFESGEIWSHYLYNIVIWAPGNPPGTEEKVRKALASADPDLVLYGTDSYDKVFRGDFSSRA